MTGNPRNDRLFREPTARPSCERLGLEPGRFVVYMPTYRSAAALGATVAWQDGERRGGPAGRRRSASMVEAARTSWVSRSSSSRTRWTRSRWRSRVPACSTTATWPRPGLGSYELLAASHSLVTDYSSIWTDYLSTGKHVAFAVPDWEAYAATRGLDESVSGRRCPARWSVLGRGRRSAFFRAIEAATPRSSPSATGRSRRSAWSPAEGNCRRLVARTRRRGRRPRRGDGRA